MASYLYSGTTGGNWSTAANWTNMTTNTTGTVPTSADDAYLHNKTVVIDSGGTVNVNKISNKATTGFTVNANAGGSATVALTNSYYPTITVGSGGIESTQATVISHVISLSGSSTTASAPYCFKIDCAGDITGGYNGSGHTINIACTGTKIQINANNVLGGITTGDNGAIYLVGNGNVVYVNTTSSITSSVGTAIRIAATTTSTMYVKATTITGGSSTPAIRLESNTSGVYVGYICDFSTVTPNITTSAVTNITASGTSPAIQSYTGTAPYFNTTPFFIQATNLNGNSNGINPLMVFNAKIVVSNIYLYDTTPTSVQYQNQTPTASTASQFWAYLTSAATTSGSLGKLIVDNLNATVSSRATQTSVDTIDDFLDTEIAAIKTSTDRIPTNPASVQSTGDQIATIN